MYIPILLPAEFFLIWAITLFFERISSGFCTGYRLDSLFFIRKQDTFIFWLTEANSPV